MGIIRTDRLIRISILTILSSSFTITESFVLTNNHFSRIEHSVSRPQKNKGVLLYSMIHEVGTQFSYLATSDPALQISVYNQQANELMTQAQINGFTQDSIDPELAREVLFSAMSHVIFDLSFFVIAPENTALLRFINVVGKFFQISNNYAPDSCVRLDELVFQLVMAGTYVSLFAKSILPTVQALVSDPKSFILDHKNTIAFQNLFEPAGFTWIHYKALVATNILDWIEIAPGNMSELHGQINDNINLSKNLHWFYNSESESFEASRGTGFACAQLMQKVKHRESTCKVVHRIDDISKYEEFIEGGATILRVNTEKIVDMIENNEDMSMSMMFLTMNCLEEECLL